MRVEGRAELTLQELDVVARPLDRVEGVAARDSGARRPDCSGFLQDVVVFADEKRGTRDEDVLGEARANGATGAGIPGGDPLDAGERTCHDVPLVKRDFGWAVDQHMY